MNKTGAVSGLREAPPLARRAWIWGVTYFTNQSCFSVFVWQLSLIAWGLRVVLTFGLAAIGAIVYGLKQDDYTSRSFGITFLFINLYTRFFEYFWNELHKAIFFIILAASFWLIGWKAEKIWNLEFIKKKEPSE